MKKFMSWIGLWLLSYNPVLVQAQQIPLQLPFGTATPPPGFSGGAFSPQMPSQGLTPQPQQSLQPPSQALPSDLQQVTRRYCNWVSWTQSSPPGNADRMMPPFSNPSPRGGSSPLEKQPTPVQSPWPGAPNYEEVRSTAVQVPQQANLPDSQPRGPLFAPFVAPQGGPGNSQQFRETVAGGQTESQEVVNSYPWQLYEPLSSIEASFAHLPVFNNAASAGITLRQYGYSLFASPISTFAPVADVPVGPDYILGPGDELMIQVWGAMESGVLRTVDRNGQIVLPGSGPIRVWGLTFEQAQVFIRNQLSRHYPGFQSTTTMGRLRTIRIYVVGEVCQPGSFTLSSLSAVTNALFAAGGPLKLGSLRNIQLKRNHHDVGTVDLYDFLLKGDKTRDFRLESGDTIFIPPIGPVVAIEGEVKRPGIYEIKDATKISDLIFMAGGTMPRAYLKRAQLIRANPNAERQVMDLDLAMANANGSSGPDFVLKDGDLLRIHASDPRIYNTISLAGAVKHPGEYELKPGMRLSDLLQKPSVLPESYLERVEIARLKDDLSTEVIQADLRRAWNGEPNSNPALKARDRITVRSEYRPFWKVKLEGEVRRPGVYAIQPGERLSSVIKRAGEFTDKAFLKGAIFTRVSAGELEKARLENFVRDHEQRLLAEAGQLTATAAGLNKDEAIAQQAVLAQRREQLRLLASKVTLGRVVVHLDRLDKFEGSTADILLEDNDTLKVPQVPQTVLVVGSVRNATSILHNGEKDVQYYINRAGGYAPDADQRSTYVLKADGSAISGFVRLREIEPGDAIVVPPSTEAKLLLWPLFRDLATIAGQIALSVAGLAAIF